MKLIPVLNSLEKKKKNLILGKIEGRRRRGQQRMRWLDGITDSMDMLSFSRSVMSNSARSHGLQHARLPCPSPSPGACSNSCPLNRWYHPTISSSVIPFSSCPQTFQASGSFLMSQLFTSGGQSIGASTSVLPMNIQDWFPLGLPGLISLQS